MEAQPPTDAEASAALPVGADLAAHHDLVEPGPGPVRRAALGLALGAALGAIAALLSRKGEG